MDTEELVVVGQHNHGAVFSSHEVILLHSTNLCVHSKFIFNLKVRCAKEAIKEEARANPLANPRNIIAAKQAELSEEARMAMPSYSGSQRLIERQREVPGKTMVDTKNLVDIEIEVL